MIEPNSKTYTDECDRLSTLEVQNCHTFWGRWFIDDQMLCTWVCVPEEKGQPLKKANQFCYAIESLRSDRGQTEFLRQIEGYDWIGKSGRKSVLRALKYFKRQTESD